MEGFVDDPPMQRGRRIVGQNKSSTRSSAVQSAIKNAESRRAATAQAKKDKIAKAHADAAIQHVEITKKQTIVSRNERTAQKLERERLSRLNTRRHAEQVDVLEKINDSILKLLQTTQFWGIMGSLGRGGLLGSMLGGIGGGRGRGRGGRRLPARDPKTGRFIKNSARAGRFGGIARGAGLLGAGAGLLSGGAMLAAGGAGMYFSTQAIRENQGRGFFEGGLNSRATGYLGNTASAALIGARLAGPWGALIGAGVGLTTSIYADFKEEIDEWIGKRWRDIKKMATAFGANVKSLWKTTSTFFNQTKNRVFEVIGKIPGAAAVGGFFASLPDYIGDAWSATKNFFGNTIPEAINKWKNLIPSKDSATSALASLFPGGSAMKATMDAQSKLGSKTPVSDLKRSLVMTAPFSLSPEEGRYRNRFKYFIDIEKGKNTVSGFQTSLMNVSDYDIRSAMLKNEDRLSLLRVALADAVASGDSKSEKKLRNEIRQREEFIKFFIDEDKRRKSLRKIEDNALSSSSVVTRSPMRGLRGADPISFDGNATDKTRKNAASWGESAKMAALDRYEVSQRYGVDFGYLMATAARESSFNRTIKASTSSALGYDQFTDATWEEVVKKYGKEHGLTMDGRTDGRQSAVALALFTRDNADEFYKEFKRKPNATETYILHVFGRSGGITFLKRYKKSPNAFAAPDYGNGGLYQNGKKTPSAANPTLFYRKFTRNSNGSVSGEPYTYKEVYNIFAGKMNNDVTSAYTQEYGSFASQALMKGGYGPEFEAEQARQAALTKSQTAADKFYNSAVSRIAYGNRFGRGMTSRQQFEETARIKHVADQISSGKIPDSDIYDAKGVVQTDKLLKKYGTGYIVPARIQDMQYGAGDVPLSTQSALRQPALPATTTKKPNEKKPIPVPSTIAAASPDSIAFIADGGDGMAILNIKGL